MFTNIPTLPTKILIHIGSNFPKEKEDQDGCVMISNGDWTYNVNLKGAQKILADERYKNWVSEGVVEEGRTISLRQVKYYPLLGIKENIAGSNARYKDVLKFLTNCYPAGSNLCFEKQSYFGTDVPVNDNEECKMTVSPISLLEIFKNSQLFTRYQKIAFNSVDQQLYESLIAAQSSFF